MQIKISRGFSKFWVLRFNPTRRTTDSGTCDTDNGEWHGPTIFWSLQYGTQIDKFSIFGMKMLALVELSGGNNETCGLIRGNCR